MSSVPPPSGPKSLHPFWTPDPEVGGKKFLQSVGNYLPTDKMPYPKRLKSKHQLRKNVTTCFLSDKIMHPIADIKDPSKKATHFKHNNSTAWFRCRHLYTFSSFNFLFFGDALYTTYQIYREEILEDNCRPQVDVVTCARHSVSTCFLKIHLFHLSNNLRNYTNNNTLL
jgi:hypothetical protein